MTQEIVGSREQSQTRRGQNQDLTGSSTREKSLAPIPNVSVPNVGRKVANGPDDTKRLAEIEGHPIPTHRGMIGATKAAMPGATVNPRPSSVRVSK